MPRRGEGRGEGRVYDRRISNVNAGCHRGGSCVAELGAQSRIIQRLAAIDNLPPASDARLAIKRVRMIPFTPARREPNQWRRR